MLFYEIFLHLTYPPKGKTSKRRLNIEKQIKQFQKKANSQNKQIKKLR